MQSEWRLYRKTYAEIDLSALQSNFLFLRSLLPSGGFICPMVKGNAYGHGDLAVARTLRASGAEFLGVGLVEEGVRLREGKDAGEILVFSPFDEHAVGEVVDNSLTPVLNQPSMLDAYADELRSRGRKGKAHLKFNTGMNRLGFQVDQLNWLTETLRRLPEIQIEGICTHLLLAEDLEQQDGETQKQLRVFAELLKSFQKVPFVHVWNSAGLLKCSTAGTSMLPDELRRQKIGARPGIAIYGLGVEASGITPILSWKTQIVAFQKLRVGDSVSYCANWRARRDSRVGILPIGYADGYWRHLSGQAFVLVRGRRAPVVGNVCMDYVMIDLTELEQELGPTPMGAEVVLIGRQGKQTIAADDIAKQVGTISYEVMTRISERVPRIYVE